jgi:hypothetical protein
MSNGEWFVCSVAVIVLVGIYIASRKEDSRAEAQLTSMVEVQKLIKTMQADVSLMSNEMMKLKSDVQGQVDSYVQLGVKARFFENEQRAFEAKLQALENKLGALELAAAMPKNINLTMKEPLNLRMIYRKASDKSLVKVPSVSSVRASKEAKEVINTIKKQIKTLSQ